MAPTKPKSGRGVVAKPVQRKRPVQRRPSFETDSDDELFPPQGSEPNGIMHDSYDDLQSIADRVGKEVDTFAETLDQYRDQLNEPHAQREAALQLCTTFRDYARDQVRKLKKQHQVQRLQDGRQTFTAQSQTPFGGTASVAGTDQGAEDAGKKTVRQWQAEADTWDLFLAVLKARYPSDTEAESQIARLQELGAPHQYMKSDQLWRSFILSDDAAKERHLIVKWLEQAAGNDKDVKQILSPEQQKSSPMATNGWMETREKIKGAKRIMMGANQPLAIRRSDSSDPLVSNLDPDAPSRQGKTLERGDSLSERAMWQTCFELLCQGKPWSEITAWCLERNQGWKALSMGVASDEDAAIATSGPACGVLFRRMCLIAARSPSADPYESAVYGLLAGDLETVKKVCRSWNDYVFAHYNHQLISQFDRYLLSFQQLRLPLDFARKHGLMEAAPASSPMTAANAAKELISSLNTSQQFSKEARSPMRLIQGSLIANCFYELCLRVGTAIAEEASDAETAAVIKPIRRLDNTALSESAIVEDPDALRIVSHILIIMRAIDRTAFADGDRDEFDNIIAGYIQLLRSVAKGDTTPLYGSLMAESRCVASLAQVIADNQDPKDAMDFIKITQVYNVDAIAIITGQYNYQLERVLASDGPSYLPFRMLEASKEDLYPSQRIRLEGLPTELTGADKALVSGLEIFYLVEGQWKVTFTALATVCRKLLAEGRFATVRAIVEQVRFDELSQSKSIAILGHPINVMNLEQNTVLTDEKLLVLQAMQDEAQVYYDIAALIDAINALENWRSIEDEFVHKLPKPASVPSKVKRAIEEVSICMEPLLSGILVEAKDEEEAALHAKIRAQYLPEIVLAYLTALSTAGHIVSRDELLTAMDTSTIIANNEQSGLRKAFVDAGRMTELVTMFAEVSKVSLKLNEVKAIKRNKKERGGRSLGIWEIFG